MSTVLIIDDEWSIREVTTLMLERAGYKTLSAASAAEGLEVLAANDISLVIIDVVLPERNGLDLALEVHQRKPGLPIILMSGRISTEADSIQNFTGHFGIVCSIAKPFTQLQLIQVVKNSLSSSC
jgi:DNA-binding NtrC family response regulator